VAGTDAEQVIRTYVDACYDQDLDGRRARQDGFDDRESAISAFAGE
jgi:hypothetical protein